MTVSTSTVIGIVAPDYLSATSDDVYFLRMVRGLENELTMARRKTAQLIRADQFAEVPNLREWIENNAISGIINTTGSNYDGMLRLCREIKVPFVQIDHHKQSTDEVCPTVKINNAGAIIAVVDHLVDMGHRRIGIITGRPEIPAAQQRLEGYKRGLQYARIPFESELAHFSNGNWDSGYKLTLTLLALPHPPTAIIAYNDTAALGVMAAIRTCGLEPGRDVSVVGFDDVPFARESNPPLTTIRQPIEEIARQAARLIVDLIEGCLTETERLIETALIIRRSTGPAKG